MSPTTTLEREDHGDVTVLRIRVPTLLANDVTEAIFDQAYAVVDHDRRPNLVLNVDGVDYLASGAIGKLVRLLQKAQQAGGKLVLCRPSRSVCEVLRITHLSDVLVSYDDEHEAVLAFQQ